MKKVKKIIKHTENREQKRNRGGDNKCVSELVNERNHYVT